VLLLADEPTGNLDPSTSDRLHDILFAVSREHASAMVLVTHNLELAARADRTLRVRDGHLVPLNGAAGEGGDPAQPATSS
jgi:predicted ABC-type transport system involved in lysophospholipase L1 biosynthesis ATPase subunit